MSYLNLKAEMVKHGVTQANAADLLGMSPNNFSLKICEKVPFTVNEIKAIREAFFPDMQMDYLCESDGNVPSESERAKALVQRLADNIATDGTPMDAEKAEVINDLHRSSKNCNPAIVNHVLGM